MKVLLDECIDWRLSRDIVGHDLKTTRQMGWASIMAVIVLCAKTNRLADAQPGVAKSVGI